MERGYSEADIEQLELQSLPVKRLRHALFGAKESTDGDDATTSPNKVTGIVYEETDGIRTGISNVLVVITDSGNNKHTVKTDNNGEYEALVPPGSTTISIDEETIPTGYSQTEPEDCNAL